MLQQILSDMYIDPQLLAELDEEQKHILFCKMREEQVRRWKEKEEKYKAENRKPRPPPKPGSKRVKFMMGADNNPWTWVMGEHPDDVSIEEILEREAKEKARKQAEQEVLRKQEEENQPAEITIDNQTVQLRRKSLKDMNREYSLEKEVASILECSLDKPPVDKEAWLSQKKQEIKSKEEMFRRLTERRSEEIYQEIKAQQRKSLEAAEKESEIQDNLWREQERKSKEVEKQIREIARHAREEHKRSMMDTENQRVKPAVPPKTVGLKPVPPKLLSNLPAQSTSRSKDAKLFTKADIMDWFQKEEFPSGAVSVNGNGLAPWFHGFITRIEAEHQLKNFPEGTFLVRVNDRIKGYVISYKSSDRCKHFLIDASPGYCQFFGSNQTVFEKLKDLIHHHMTHPITKVGNEQLLNPCPRSSSTSLADLMTSVRL